MTESHFKELALKLFLVIICVAFWCALISMAVANTYWVPSTEKYFKYDTTPTKTTGKVYKYIQTTDIETARATWVKLPNSWIKYTSANGAIKYGEEVVLQNPVPVQPVCAAFVCNDDFGWTFDLTKNTVLACPMVKIDKGVAIVYDGKQAGTDKCR